MKNYSDLKLHQKISIVMATIFLSLAIILTSISLMMFTSFYEKEATDIATQWARVSERNISQIWSNISERVLKTVVKGDFVTKITNTKLSELQKRVDLQDSIENINSSSSFIYSSFFLTNNNEIIYSFNDIPTDELGNFTFDKLKNIDGITMLKECNSPFKRDGLVIPILIPYKQIDSSPYLGITSDRDVNLILVILLNSTLLKNELYESTSKEVFLNPRLFFNGELILGPEFDIGDMLVVRNECSIEGLEVEISVNRSELTPMKSILFIWVISLTFILILIGVILIRLTALRLTAPFSRITRMMREMKDSSYHFDVKPENSDESGLLIAGLNDMYKELSDTMQRIKEEEEQKYKYLSQMLTEQINPHFTYNTLEMINMEIASGNYLSASDMVSAFSLFLRHSLNHGEYLITVSNELLQVENYMKIMNYRLNGVIEFRVNVLDDCRDILIPKSILQPLVENSIKHGFDNLNSSMLFNPFIEVSIKKEEDVLIISVVDNGIGIDIEKANASISGDDNKQVGLANISKRLKMFDKDCIISFYSIPYFSNEVKIEIHLNN